MQTLSIYHPHLLVIKVMIAFNSVWSSKFISEVILQRDVSTLNFQG
jgi:hypothetical protein